MTEQGHVLAVSQERLGDDLVAAAAAGDTVLLVSDIADFDELGGMLSLNGQVMDYTSADDGTGTIALAGALVAAAAAGDSVFVWDQSRQAIVSDLVAQVQVDGDVDGDPQECSVAHHLVDDIPGGIRGLVGESVLIEEEDDDWRVVDVLGLSAVGKQGLRWEADDTHTLTAGEITAGTVTFSLSKFPTLESMFLVLAGVPQQPTEYTVNYAAPSITVPLSGWEKSGDVIWVHYTYWGVAPAGEADQPDAPPVTTPPATNPISAVNSSSGTNSQPTMPVGALAGDLILVCAMHSTTMSAGGFTDHGASGSVTHIATTGTYSYKAQLLSLVHPGGSPTMPTFLSLGAPQPLWIVLAIRGPSTVTGPAFSTVGDAASAPAALPGGSGTAFRFWGAIMGASSLVSGPSVGSSLAASSGIDIACLASYDDGLTLPSSTTPGCTSGWAMGSLRVI